MAADAGQGAPTLHYLGACEITYPHSGVNRVEEIAQLTGVSKDQDGHEVSTKLFVNNSTQQAKVVGVLEKAGFKGKVKPKQYTYPPKHVLEGQTHYSITIEGKAADQVLSALAGRDDIIPTFIAKEIEAKALELHPGQQAINEAAAAYGQESLAEIVRRRRASTISSTPDRP